MFVSRLSWEQWEQGTDIGTEIQQPSWPDIEKAIMAMEERRRTIVTLHTGEDAHMGIGYGGGGKYIAYETGDNLVFHNLLANPSLTGTETLSIGGQQGQYRREAIATIEQVLRVALRYAETGELEPSESWDEV